MSLEPMRSRLFYCSRYLHFDNLNHGTKRIIVYNKTHERVPDSNIRLTNSQKILTQKHREGLRKLLTFTFKKNSRYNLADKRLKMLERQIQARAKLLLEK